MLIFSSGFQPHLSNNHRVYSGANQENPPGKLIGNIISGCCNNLFSIATTQQFAKLEILKHKLQIIFCVGCNNNESTQNKTNPVTGFHNQLLAVAYNDHGKAIIIRE